MGLLKRLREAEVGVGMNGCVGGRLGEFGWVDGQAR